MRKYKTTLSVLLFFQILAIKPSSFLIIHALFIHCTLCAERVQGTFAAPGFFFFTAFYSHWASFLFCVSKMHHLSATANLVMLL